MFFNLIFEVRAMGLDLLVCTHYIATLSANFRTITNRVNGDHGMNNDGMNNLYLQFYLSKSPVCKFTFKI